MGVTDFLKREHEIVLRVLEEADGEIAAMAATGEIDAPFLRTTVSFLDDFLTSSHQVKEELRLFPRVERTGMPVFDVPLAILRREHDEERKRIDQLMGEMDAFPRETSVATIRNDLQVFAALLRRHMAREEEILFPLAERSLTPMDQSELEREFRAVDESGAGAGGYERYAAVARRARKKAIPPGAPSSPPPEASP